jgi:hypothetical protein
MLDVSSLHWNVLNTPLSMLFYPNGDKVQKNLRTELFSFGSIKLKKFLSSGVKNLSILKVEITYEELMLKQ